MIAALIALSSAASLACPQGGALLDAADLQFALESLASAHPDLVSVLPIGKSRAGRSIDALRIGAEDPAPGTPAILVVANLEGPQVWTSMLAFDLARQLAETRSEDERVGALLEDLTVYVIPRADPHAGPSLPPAMIRQATPRPEPSSCRTTSMSRSSSFRWWRHASR